MDFRIEEEIDLANRLIEKGRTKEFARGQSVYEEGEKPFALYYVEKGLVVLTKLSASGNESLLRIFKAHQFFGHRSLFSDEMHHATAKCLEPSMIVCIEKEEVMHLFDQEPKAYFFLARALAKELRRAENRSVMISEGLILERVASAILLIQKLYTDHLWTRNEIASYCATRTATVIRALAELENRGFIEQDGRRIEIKMRKVYSN
ncbi:MAG: Crp/Fnr family transcriptional regulator [Bdellovibrionota bacterium]